MGRFRQGYYWWGFVIKGKQSAGSLWSCFSKYSRKRTYSKMIPFTAEMKFHLIRYKTEQEKKKQKTFTCRLQMLFQDKALEVSHHVSVDHWWKGWKYRSVDHVQGELIEHICQEALKRIFKSWFCFLALLTNFLCIISSLQDTAVH